MSTATAAASATTAVVRRAITTTSRADAWLLQQITTSTVNRLTSPSRMGLPYEPAYNRTAVRGFQSYATLRCVTGQVPCRRRRHGPSKCRKLVAQRRGVTSHKTGILSHTAVETSKHSQDEPQFVSYKQYFSTHL